MPPRDPTPGTRATRSTASGRSTILQAQVNYAYLATHVTTLIGKQIVQAFYGQRAAPLLFRGLLEWRQDGADGSAALP